MAIPQARDKGVVCVQKEVGSLQNGQEETLPRAKGRSFNVGVVSERCFNCEEDFATISSGQD